MRKMKKTNPIVIKVWNQIMNKAHKEKVPIYSIGTFSNSFLAETTASDND
jgi:hypothetical protein